MYMLRYKFREAVDLQGGGNRSPRGGGGGGANAPPKCGPDVWGGVCMCARVIAYICTYGFVTSTEAIPGVLPHP